MTFKELNVLGAVQDICGVFFRVFFAVQSGSKNGSQTGSFEHKKKALN